MHRIFPVFVLIVTLFAPAYAGAESPNIHGKTYALIIGNNEYDYLPNLRTAVSDATAIAVVLQERYDFDDDAVTLLINATRRDTMKALSGLRKSLTPEDQLMLYYSGHGEFDPAADEGFWQPVDAEPANDFTWISSTDVQRYLFGIPARHILVIADSAFTWRTVYGADFRTGSEDKYIDYIEMNFSRRIIWSGATRPMAYDGSSDHSVFAYFLIKALSENRSPSISAYRIYQRLVQDVRNNSNQTPEFGALLETGVPDTDEFTLILRKGSGG